MNYTEIGDSMDRLEAYLLLHRKGWFEPIIDEMRARHYDMVGDSDVVEDVIVFIAWNLKYKKDGWETVMKVFNQAYYRRPHDPGKRFLVMDEIKNEIPEEPIIKAAVIGMIIFFTLGFLSYLL